MRRRSTIAFLMCLPLIVIISSLVLYPALYSIYLSMLNKSQTRFIGLGNFSFLLSRDVFWMVMEQTAIFALSAVFFKALIGLITAHLINNLPVKGQRKWRGMLLVPWVIPLALSSLGWWWLFDPTHSAFNYVLSSLGLEEIPWLSSPYWPQFGVPCGLLLSNLAVLAFSAWATGDDFLVWGWRIPFALSIILVGIGLWIRLGILETPVFQKLLDTNKVEKAPILEVIKKQPWQILWSALLRLSEQAPFYVFTAFIFAYAVGTLKMDRNFILAAVMAAACVSFFTIPLAGHFSDLIGRKKMYLIGVVVMGIFGFVYFGMVDTAVPALVFIAIVLSLIPHDLQYGPQAALIAEAFTPRLRYSGASLGYQLASIIAGGPAPLIATWLFATYHSGYAISVYIAVLAVISFIAAALMPDYTGKDISDDAYSED